MSTNLCVISILQHMQESNFDRLLVLLPDSERTVPGRKVTAIYGEESLKGNYHYINCLITVVPYFKTGLFSFNISALY